MYDIGSGQISINIKIYHGTYLFLKQEKLPESPYIVKYYGGLVFKNNGNSVIVTLMELCTGGNLFDML